MSTKSDDSAVAIVSAVSNKQFTVTLTGDGSTNVELSSGNTVVTIPVTVTTTVEQDIEVWPTNIMQNAVVKLTPGSTTTLAVTKLSPALTSGQKLDVKLNDTVNSKYITAEYDPSVGQLGSVIVHASPDLPTDGSVSGSIDVTLPGDNYPESSVHYEAVSESSMPKITDLQFTLPITGSANTDIVVKPSSITPSDLKMTFDEVEVGFANLSGNADWSSYFDDDGNLVINVSATSTGTVPLIYSLGKDFKVINLELDIK